MGAARQENAPGEGIASRLRRWRALKARYPDPNHLPAQFAPGTHLCYAIRKIGFLTCRF